LTDFQNFFTAAFCEKFVVKWLLNIPPPPHLNYVATLPRTPRLTFTMWHSVDRTGYPAIH